MPSQCSQMWMSYTARGLDRYEIEVSHPELGKFQRLKGDNQYVVTQKANAKMQMWDEMWRKRVAVQEKRNQQDAKVRAAEENLQEATDRTEEAQAEQESLRTLLVDSLDHGPLVDWEQLKDFSPCPISRPLPPDRPVDPPKPKLGREPNCYDPEFEPEKGFFDWLFPGKKKAKEEAAESRFQAAQQLWQTKLDGLQAQHAETVAQQEQQWKRRQQDYQDQLADWDQERGLHSDAEALLL
ncbi:MAG TPA: hypothetical protein EYN66_04975, partial [Myxococcales bacterium]|nr:hypothetical protein [Myxococcales bacterium]